MRSYASYKRVLQYKINRNRRSPTFETGDPQLTRYFMRPGVNPLWRQPQRSPSLSPPEQHAGRRPGSRATNRNAPVSTSEPSPDAETDLSSTHNKPADDPIFLPSKWPVYMNEALCKSRGKLSFAVRNLKRNYKINDTRTVDGPIKIRTIHNRIVNIDTMTKLETYMWKLLYLFSQLWPHIHIMFYLPLVFGYITKKLSSNIIESSIFLYLAESFSLLSLMYPYFIFLLLLLHCSGYIGTVSLSCTLFYKDFIMLIDLLPKCHVKVLIQNDRSGIQFEILHSPKLMWWREKFVQFVWRKL